MKNTVVCKNCASENPFYGLICNKCKSYLRERVYNIDLWKTISLLIESPSKAFKLIIFSEHKNFLVLALILISGKMLVNIILMNTFFFERNSYPYNYFANYIFTIIFTSLLILLFAALISYTSKLIKTSTKLADNISVITYSFVPYIFGFLILLPIELILFGEYLFYSDPSPFDIKETLAYTLLAFEGLVFVWSVFLTFIGIKVQTDNIPYSIIFSLFIHFIFHFALFLTANIFFI